VADDSFCRIGKRPANRLKFKTFRLMQESKRAAFGYKITGSVHGAAGHLRTGRSAMSRQEARCLTRRTELEHRG
jgi:hypothetical protein